MIGAVGVAIGALSQAAGGSPALRPPPGSPDPKQMVLRAVDLGRDATVASQGYYRSKDLPSVISYRREFRSGRVGVTELSGLESEADIGTSPASTAYFFTSMRQFFGSKQGRALFKREFLKSAGDDLGLISNLKVGRPRSLGVGDGSFDVLVSFRLLGLRSELHYTVFRVERVLGVLLVAGKLTVRVPRSVVVKLAKIMVARSRVELAPRNTGLPTVSGTPQVGQTLTATPGTWTSSPTSFTYQWQRCDGAGANCADIPGATAQSYVLTDADVGLTLRVVVTARNSTGAAIAASAPTTVVSAAGAPANTSPPTISGVAQQGQTLAAGIGTWSGNPTSFGYQWQRCNAAGSSCTTVDGATGQTYLVGPADGGFTLRVAVTAQNAAGSTTAISAPSAVVP